MATLLHLVCDYAPGGLEFAEIVTRLHSHLADPGSVVMHTTSTPPLDTIAVGFVTGQLALGPVRERTVIFANAAPRRDTHVGSPTNAGRSLRYARLTNGVEILSVDSDYAFGFVKEQIEEFRDIDCPVSGSQFRSRDFFPKHVAAIVDRDRSTLTDTLDPSGIPAIAPNLIAWTDGFGNMKTTMRKSDLQREGLVSGSRVLVTLNGVTLAAVVSEGGFAVERGVLALSAGSSGGDDPFVELFLRVHHLSEKPAARRFDFPEGGTPFEVRREA